MKSEIQTRAGKRKFIRCFMNSVRNELLAKVPAMPEEWDGHELRWLVADKFAWEQHHRTGEFRLPFNQGAGWRRRVREYNNERLTRDL